MAHPAKTSDAAWTCDGCGEKAERGAAGWRTAAEPGYGNAECPECIVIHDDATSVVEALVSITVHQALILYVVYQGGNEPLTADEIADRIAHLTPAQVGEAMKLGPVVERGMAR